MSTTEEVHERKTVTLRRPIVRPDGEITEVSFDVPIDWTHGCGSYNVTRNRFNEFESRRMFVATLCGITITEAQNLHIRDFKAIENAARPYVTNIDDESFDPKRSGRVVETDDVIEVTLRKPCSVGGVERDKLTVYLERMTLLHIKGGLSATPDKVTLAETMLGLVSTFYEVPEADLWKFDVRDVDFLFTVASPFL